ncbi:hypothetical protein Bbelb_116440 [Branchiostoma belcheri]|nr:hypothetical protein Bbelb_116440 [Branchiostoma belcheri]
MLYNRRNPQSSAPKEVNSLVGVTVQFCFHHFALCAQNKSSRRNVPGDRRAGYCCSDREGKIARTPHLVSLCGRSPDATDVRHGVPVLRGDFTLIGQGDAELLEQPASFKPDVPIQEMNRDELATQIFILGLTGRDPKEQFTSTRHISRKDGRTSDHQPTGRAGRHSRSQVFVWPQSKLRRSPDCSKRFDCGNPAEKNKSPDGWENFDFENPAVELTQQLRNDLSQRVRWSHPSPSGRSSTQVTWEDGAKGGFSMHGGKVSDGEKWSGRVKERDKGDRTIAHPGESVGETHVKADGELSEQSCAELRDEVFICDRVLAIDCKLETDGTRPVRPAIPALRAPELSVCHRLTDGELSEQSCAELHRKEVKAKLNRDANQRIDFIWRRALRVSQTDGELSEQSCAELQRKEVKVKLNGDANQRIDFFRRRALRGYRGGLYEQPPWRSSAELLHGGCSCSPY